VYLVARAKLYATPQKRRDDILEKPPVIKGKNGLATSETTSGCRLKRVKGRDRLCR